MCSINAIVDARLTVQQNACAAAVLLKAQEAELPGAVALLFQPAEEGKRFVEECW